MHWWIFPGLVAAIRIPKTRELHLLWCISAAVPQLVVVGRAFMGGTLPGALWPSWSQVDFVGLAQCTFWGEHSGYSDTDAVARPRPSGFIFLVHCQAVRQLRSKKDLAILSLFIRSKWLNSKPENDNSDDPDIVLHLFEGSFHHQHWCRSRPGARGRCHLPQTKLLYF